MGKMKFRCKHGHEFVLDDSSKLNWKDNLDGYFSVELECKVCGERQKFVTPKEYLKG